MQDPNDSTPTVVDEPQTNTAQVPDEPVSDAPVVDTPSASDNGQSPTGTATPDADEVYLLKLKVDGQDKVYDVRDPAQKAEAIELSQKGFGYTSKMQAFAEAERARQQQDQMFQALTNNEAVWKSAMASQMGLNPNALSYDPKPPDVSWKEINPEAYGRAMAEYEFQLREKESVTRAVNTYIQSAVQVNNQALFQRGRITHNLSDQDNSQVVQFMQQEMRPNGTGLYSDQQYERAVNALFGKERTAQARLTTANKIQEKIKGAVNPPKTSTRATPAMTEKESKDKAFLEFVKEMKTAK